MAQLDHSPFMSHALFWAAQADASLSNDGWEEADHLSPIEVAEKFILSHRPENAVQMIIQLEIICNDLDEGHRHDGLDVRAIRNVQRALFDSLTPEDDGLSQFAMMRAGSSTGQGGPFDAFERCAH